MQRRESAASRDKIQKGLLLLWRNPRVIRVNGDAIEPCEIRRIQVGEILRVNQFDTFGGEHRLKLLEAFSRAMMAIISQEQNPEVPGRARRLRGAAHCGPKQVNSDQAGAKTAKHRY